MNSDNPFDGEELPPGASVFGDVAPQVGSSVFGNSDLSSENSVFTDVETELKEVPIEAIESRKASVFGDVESPIGFDDSPQIITEPRRDTEDVDADGVTLDLRAATLASNKEEIEDTDLEDTTDDYDDSVEESYDIAEESYDIVEESYDVEENLVESSERPGFVTDDEEVIDDAEPTSSYSYDDGIERGEPIALDIDPDDDDGLEAWSDLEPSSSPADGFIDSDDHTLSFDEVPELPADEAELPTEQEPEVVRIGAVDSGDFFEFDEASSNADARREVPGGQVAAAASSDLQPRVVTGAALLAVAVLAFALHPLLALALIVIVVTVASGEFFNALRVAGYQPATLLGLAGSIAMPLAVYVRGTQAVALILGLTIVFGLLWYVVGVASEMPVMNLGVTVLGVAYIGGLASFGAAMLENANRSTLANDDGTELLLIALILTIASDIGAYFSGRSFGRTPLTAISPNKTWEGLIGGAAMTIVTSIVFVSLLGDQFLSPVSDNVTVLQALILGAAVAIMAPLGDLAESLVKRDLGVKDMGSILPGHGGVLDRVDALLFVLPTVYFFALAFVYAT